MRNWTRLFLASGAALALAIPNFASFLGDVSQSGSSVLAQEDDFWNEEEDDDDIFQSDDNGPFAPSSIPVSDANRNEPESTPAPKPDSSKGIATESESPEKSAKYLRSEDVPDEEKTEEDFVKTVNPAERAVLSAIPEENPTSADYFRAAAQIARVGRPLFAKTLLEKAASAPDPSPRQAAETLRELGSGKATYLTSLPEVGTLGSQVYDKLSEIARQEWEGDAALRDAINRATTGTTEERAAAIVDLRRGGSAAVSVLVGDLLGSDETRVNTARELLPFFEEDCVEALIAATRGADSKELAPVVSLLGSQTDLRVAPALLAILYDGDASIQDATRKALASQTSEIPTAASFAAEAYKTALGFQKRTELFPDVVDGKAERWNWDEEKGIPVESLVDLETAYADETAYWANLAYRIGAKENALPVGGLELAIVSTAEQKFATRGDAGLAELRATFPKATTDELQSAIQYALDSKRPLGALLPVLWLRESGNESLVYSKNVASPIVNATVCPNRRVRYAALSSIVGWNPERPYIGATQVGRALEWFATSTGEKIVVVACPKLQDCSILARPLKELGYKTIPVTTGREAILAAQSSADVEFVLADAHISGPDARAIAQTLSADVRTADAPLLVATASDADDSKAGVLVGRESNALVYPKPYDLTSCSMAIQSLFDRTKPNQVPAEQRAQQGKAAALAFLELLKTRPDVYEFTRANDLIAKFLNNPATFEIGLEYAASVPTNYAQTALVQTIGDSRFSMSDRRQALDAFRKQLAANGSLMRENEVAKMYDRYNASEKEDAETQKLLSDMLDAYEQAR